MQFRSNDGGPDRVEAWIAPDSGFEAGTSLKGALEQAVAASRASNDTAHAVVEARNGVLRVVPVATRDADNNRQGLIVDGRFLGKGITKVEAEQSSDMVKAIVGRETIFNFSNRELPTIDLSGPDAWRGEPLAVLRTTPDSRFDGAAINIVGTGSAVRAGETLEAAMQKAALAARDGFHPTQAIVQDDAGAYYITRVETGDTGQPFVRLRDVVGAEAHGSSLRMLVGTKQFYDFTQPKAGLRDLPQANQALHNKHAGAPKGGVR